MPLPGAVSAEVAAPELRQDLGATAGGAAAAPEERHAPLKSIAAIQQPPLPTVDDESPRGPTFADSRAAEQQQQQVDVARYKAALAAKDRERIELRERVAQAEDTVAKLQAENARLNLGGPAPSTLAAWRERSRFREGQVAPVVEQRLAELAGPSDSLPLRLRQLVGQLRHLRSARRVELRQLVGSLSGAQVSNGQETRKAAGSPQRAEVAQREGCAPRAWACARRNHRTIQPFQRRKDSSSDSLETTGGDTRGIRSRIRQGTDLRT